MFVPNHLLDRAIEILGSHKFEHHWRYEDDTGGQLTMEVAELVFVKLNL
jgi:hypothetical protein